MTSFSPFLRTERCQPSPDVRLQLIPPMHTSPSLLVSVFARRFRPAALRPLAFASLLLAVVPPLTAQPGSWWKVGDAAFVQQFGSQALGDSLVGQSTVAWMLFARVNQPQKYNSTTYTTWELWPSNADTFSPAAKAFVPAQKVRTRPHLQSPKLQRILAHRRGATFTPPPAAAGEEVTRNLLSYDYIVANGLTTASSAWKRLSSGPNLNFPLGAIEIKADWQTGTLPGAYTDTAADGTVYSLVGLHIMMKFAATPSDPFHSDQPSWFWTTFEYKNNPGLANAQSFLTYHDALTPAQSTAILKQAGLDQSPWTNYVCNGTQIQYFDAKNPIIRLGNTTMEDFAFTPTNATSPAQWTSWNVSCHTCHGSGSANGLGHNGPGGLHVNPYFFDDIDAVVGPLPPTIAAGGYKSFDFVWSIWNAN